MYKPLGPYSAVLAMALLIGGLIVLVLDLGKPDRLIVAMTTYNFKSIFAWNIYLYTGFLAIVLVYLWFMMEQKMKPYSRAAGFVAFFWRLALTTGTGSIFGFLVAREAYDAAILAPMFIIMSFSFGLAFYIVTLQAAFWWGNRPLGEVRLTRLKNLLGIFVGAVMYFVLVYNLTNLYITQHHGFERFLLVDGGVYTFLFWFGQIFIGGIVPLVLLYIPPFSQSRTAILSASYLVLAGGFVQVYLIVIGGQAFPMSMFPGKEIVESSFFDAGVASYVPSLPEAMLGIGGVALALALVAVACRALRILPVSLADPEPEES
jgi:molybdopterin-containing oxidoreductase family membrane subunit